MNKNSQRILMCPPEFFSVDYDINPWMSGNTGMVNIEQTKNQWHRLRSTISKYAEIEEMMPAEQVPDMVFTANAGVVYGNKAIVSQFTPIERQPEEQYFRTWFQENDFEILEFNNDIRFEGAGDCLRDREHPCMWAGYGFRTDKEAHKEISTLLDLEVVSMKLVDPRFYHIDTCFCPLSNGFIMYYPGAFDADSLAEIKRRVSPNKQIIVDEKDATNFACNSVNIGDVVIMNQASKDLKIKIEAAGFDIEQVDLSEFLKAGGSAKCLTLKLNEPIV